MDENVKKNYEYWCTSPIFDDATKSELKSLEGNEDEIFDRFYRELSTSRVLQQRALQLHLTLAVCLLSLRILLHVY